MPQRCFKLIFAILCFGVLLLFILILLKQRKKKNLVFTSAGDNTEFYKNWLSKNREYDIWVVYYGNNDTIFKKYESLVDRIWRRKGSKFQNFYYIYMYYYNEIVKYDAFYIVDDDIIMSTDDINELFHILYKYNLSICQPSFTKDSKISHRITVQMPENKLRYTNFIEVNTPVFSKKALRRLMKYYDPSLIGWGIDYLYIWANGIDKKDKYAVVDYISCINPKDDDKTDGRELNKIDNYNKRAIIWKKIADKYKIPYSWEHKTYRTIKNKI